MEKPKRDAKSKATHPGAHDPGAKHAGQMRGKQLRTKEAKARYGVFAMPRGFLASGL